MSRRFCPRKITKESLKPKDPENESLGLTICLIKSLFKKLNLGKSNNLVRLEELSPHQNVTAEASNSTRQILVNTER